MSDAWDRAAEMADKHANQGGIFVKLVDDGDKVVGAFCGDPHAREVVWTGEGYEPYDEGSPAHKGKRPSLRVAMNFFVPGEGMKIIELNNTTFKTLLKLRSKYALSKWLFEVERDGAKGDPKTKFSILPEGEMEPAVRAQLEAAELHDLANVRGDAQRDEADTPVEERLAEQFMASLRRLPKSAVEAFLAELGVERVRDVRTADAARARELIGRLEAKHAPKASAEVDPFG